MELSKNFSLGEMTISGTAKRLGIKNIPNKTQIEALRLLAINVLQPIHNHFRVAILLSNAFRSKELNKAVGGSRTSQHMEGEAADIDMDNTTISNREIFDFIRLNLTFDQLIYEFGNSKNPDWVHVSWNSKGKQRNQVLIAKKIAGKTTYQHF